MYDFENDRQIHFRNKWIFLLLDLEASQITKNQAIYLNSLLINNRFVNGDIDGVSSGHKVVVVDDLNVIIVKKKQGSGRPED